MRALGIDLCEVERIRRAMESTPGFLQRYYTEEEQTYIASRGAMGAQSAAAMFAAKEAYLKALGGGLSGGVSMREVGVTHLPGGAPAYALTGEAARQLDGARAFLSLTHEAGVAAAVCVID